MNLKNSKLQTQNSKLINSYTHSLIYPFTRFLLPASFFLLPFLTGCAVKTTPVFITFKSPQIKISDEGFLKEGFNYKELTIYKAGNVPVKFLIKNNKICINNQCINKYYFIKKYFDESDKNIFDTILEKKPFKNIKIIKIKDGFIQKKRFFYKVTKNSVLFKDKKIIVFIKYLKEKK